MPRNPINTPPNAKDATTDEDLQGLVKRQVDEALQWREEHLDDAMEKATRFYRGEKYGDEREGRSQIVTTEVRDGIGAMMPSLMKVFTGSNRAVEFKPRGVEDIPLTEQQTEYINYIFFNDSNGFLELHSAFKDALIRKLGVLKWWWEEKEVVEGSEHTGLTVEDLQLLAADEYTTIVSQTPQPDGTFDARLKREYTDGRIRVKAVPPEEFIFSPSATCLEDADMVGHVREITVSDAVAMGVPKDMALDNVGPLTRTQITGLAESRRIDKGSRTLYEDETDESRRPVVFTEVYVMVDDDGDGVAELHRVQCVGDACEIWQDDLVDQRPFALFEPDPEPHTLIGQSAADYLMDIQHISSHVMRGVLDSLVAHLNPATEVVEDEVNMKDVLNQELGRVIRVQRPGMMREVATDFVGASAIPVIQHLNQIKEDRIGITRASQGLDADALQSTTRAAVSATVSAAQQRIELFARMFAETGVRTLFKGLLRTVVRNQDRARVVRLRNEFVSVDPRAWDADKDVIINVALGTGLVEDKVQMLALISDKQEQHIQQGSPLGDFAKLRANYARMTELLGLQPEEFWPQFGPEELAAYQQQQAQNQKPSEAEILQQIEMAKIERQKAKDQQDAQLKLLEIQLKQQELQMQARQKGTEMDLKAQQAALDANIKQARTQIQAQQAQLAALQTLSQTRVGE